MEWILALKLPHIREEKFLPRFAKCFIRGVPAFEKKNLPKGRRFQRHILSIRQRCRSIYNHGKYQCIFV